MRTKDNYWLRRRASSRLSRRRFVTGAAATGVGAASLGLVGCGGDDDDDDTEGTTATTPGTTATTTGQTAQPSAAANRAGGTLIINGTNFSKLEAVTGTGGGDHQYLWAVFDNLVGYKEDFSPDAKRSLAESWENPDPMTWTFNLRQGVKFHDGTDFNADAVAANFEYATAEDVQSNVRTDLMPIDSVEAVDDFTAVYHLNQPTPGLIALLGDRPGFMSSPTAIDKFGTDYGLNPVGTGAFIHEEFVTDSHTKVRKNPEYWAKDEAGSQLPYLDAIEWRIIEQAAAAVAALRTGELTVFWGLPGQYIEELSSDTNFSVINESGAWAAFFYMNNTRPPFDNVHLRRAAAFSFPRKPIIDNIYFGASEMPLGNIGPAHWAYEPSVEGQDFNPELVRASLEAAGMADGFSFEMAISSAASAVQEGEFIQASAREFGIEITLHALGTPDYYLRYIQDSFADAMAAGFSSRADPTLYFRFNYHSTGTYRNTVVGDLDPEIEALSEIADPETLKQEIAILQQRLNDDAYSAYIRHPNTVLAAAKNLTIPVFADGKPHLGFGDVWFNA